ncbi:MAG TPA: heat-inducible transcriptional repressor HrcA [Acidimicrobiales bacterium]|jgi:heat-inducible transcriptional repressor|nr:heat-inducible transcriptional repressor HrcA [Acidimicrobiales bacterium]
MLDARKAAILRVVVEEYIETAQPVGSATVARVPELAVSSATVRNEMGVLEREGYLIQPYTSAGRIPTDKGYRFFVDSLARPGSLGPTQSQLVRDFFAHAHGQLERMLHDTSQLLSDVTDCAAVVIAPSHEVATILSLQLLARGPRNLLLVVVLSNAAVEKRSFEVVDELSDPDLSAAVAHLSRFLVGTAFGAGGDVPTTGEARIDHLTGLVVDSLRGGHLRDLDSVFVGGTARMATAFDAVGTIRQVLTILEQQYVIVSLLQDVLSRGLSVAIGTELGVVPLADCSVVVAPYEVEGEHAGTVGVLGPTRMHYGQALAAVAAVSQRLGRALSEG